MIAVVHAPHNAPRVMGSKVVNAVVVEEAVYVDWRVRGL